MLPCSPFSPLATQCRWVYEQRYRWRVDMSIGIPNMCNSSLLNGDIVGDTKRSTLNWNVPGHLFAMDESPAAPPFVWLWLFPGQINGTLPVSQFGGFCCANQKLATDQVDPSAWLIECPFVNPISQQSSAQLVHRRHRDTHPPLAISTRGTRTDDKRYLGRDIGKVCQYSNTFQQEKQ